MNLTWFTYFLGVCSAFLVGFSKTGLPGVSIPGILLMTEACPNDARASVALILPVLLVGDVFAVFWFHHHANWQRLWRLFPWVLAGMIPGIFVLEYLNGNRLRPWMGWLVLIMLAIELWRRWCEWKITKHRALPPTRPAPADLKVLCSNCELYGLSPCEDCVKLKTNYVEAREGEAPEPPSPTQLDIFPHSPWFVGMTGFLAGFSTFIANAAMPVMSVYLISQGFNKREFLGTAAWFFFLLNLSKTPVYGGMGMFKSWMLPFDLWLIAPVLLGSLFGVLILRYIPQKTFNALALLLAGVAAVRLILV
jgi:uncharacterized membrane protein YfcA